MTHNLWVINFWKQNLVGTKFWALFGHLWPLSDNLIYIARRVLSDGKNRDSIFHRKKWLPYSLLIVNSGDNPQETNDFIQAKICKPSYESFYLTKNPRKFKETLGIHTEDILTKIKYLFSDHKWHQKSQSIKSQHQQQQFASQSMVHFEY